MFALSPLPDNEPGSASKETAMTRPTSEAEYLARMVPPSVRGVDRRTLLRGALGVGALLGAGGLAACSSDSSGGSGVPTGAVSGTVTVGSNQSDPVPKGAV